MMTEAKKTLSPALKKYIEAIYSISCSEYTVRITDIAAKLGLSKPSVNRAVNTLKQYGYLDHEPYGDIRLTEKGIALGRSAASNHCIIKQFLIDVLSVDEANADKEAVRLERCISQHVLKKMSDYISENAV